MNIYQSIKNSDQTNPVNALDHCNTERYKQAHSWEIKDVLELRGFNHVATSAAKPRKPERIGKQKHIMIFERDDLFIDEHNKLQLLVTNSHDGSSSLIVNIGIFRTICANGLVTGESFFEERVKHVGHDFKTKLGLAINKATDKMPEVVELVRRLKGTKLSIDQADKLARNVAAGLDKAVWYGDLLEHKRLADSHNDLYTVLNRIQEHVIKGGYKYLTEDKNGNDVIRRAREVKSIDRKRELNQYVWDACLNFLSEVVA